VVIEVKSTTQSASLKLAAEGIKLNVIKQSSRHSFVQSVGGGAVDPAE